MNSTARLLTPLAVILFAGCSHATAPGSSPAEDHAPPPAVPLQASRNRLVGRVLAVDPARGLAFVDLMSEAPTAALADGAALIARTDDLRETARLSASRYIRGRTLGAKIVSGQPAPGNEVVFFTP